VGMHDHVVEGWHDFPGFPLGRVPGRGYVALRSLENYQRFNLFRKLPPNRIGTGHMGSQNSERRRMRIVFERNVICVQPVRPECNQSTKRMSADQFLQYVRARFLEMRRQIHQTRSCSLRPGLGSVPHVRGPSCRRIHYTCFHEAGLQVNSAWSKNKYTANCLDQSQDHVLNDIRLGYVLVDRLCLVTGRRSFEVVEARQRGLWIQWNG